MRIQNIHGLLFNCSVGCVKCVKRIVLQITTPAFVLWIILLFSDTINAQTDFNGAIAAGTDDAYETSGGTMSVTASYLSTGYDGYYVGLRFANVTITQGATINSATFSAYYYTAQAGITVEIYGQAVDNAGAFTTTAGNISGRTPTTANVANWTFDISSGVWNTSPSIVNIIQEIVNRPGWVSGNAICIITHETGTTNYGKWEAIEYGWGREATITINYTPAGVDISGIAYQSDRTTSIGANRTIRAAVNGVDFGTTAETDAGGNYSISNVIANSGDKIIVYLEDETEDAASVTITDGSTDITGLDLYTDWISVKNGSASEITLANMNTARVSSEDDIEYTYSSPTLQVTAAEGVYIPASQKLSLTAGDDLDLNCGIEINGTLYVTDNTNVINIAGDWQNDGTFTHGSSKVVFDGTGNIISGGIVAGKEFYNGEISSGTVTIVTNNTEFTNNLTVNGGTLEFNALTVFVNVNCVISSGAITMDNSADALNIDGNLTVSGGTSTISDGDIYVGGSLAVSGANSFIAASSTPVLSMDASTSPVNISVTGTNNTLGLLKINKTNSTDIVNTNGNVTALEMNITEGVFNIGANTVYISETGVISVEIYADAKLKMVTSGGVFDVDGHFKMMDNSEVEISDGTIYFGNNFSATGISAAFDPSGGTVVFDRNSKNEFDIDADDYFYNVEITTSGWAVCPLDDGSVYGTITINGNLTVNTGELSMVSDASDNITMDMNGNFTMNGGIFTPGTSTSHTVAGNWDCSGGTFQATAGKITFDKSGTQSITTGGTNYFYDVDIAGTSTVTIVSTTVQVTDLLDVDGAVQFDNAGDIITIGSASADGSMRVDGTLTISAGTIQGVSGHTADMDIYGTVNATGGAFSYVDADGLYIRNTATITALDNIVFSNHPGGTGCFLKVEIADAAIHTGCSFAAISSGYNVIANNASADFVMRYYSGAGAGENLDYDLSGNVYWNNGEYYVNDNSTTDDVWCTAVGNDANHGLCIARPKRTISDIINDYTLIADNIVYVDDGTYNEMVTVTYNDDGTGTSDMVTFQGAGASKTIIDGGGTLDNGFFLNEASYILIDGFTVQNCDEDGIRIYSNLTANASYNEIRYCTITGGSGVGDDGIYINMNDAAFSANYNKIHHCTINVCGSHCINSDGFGSANKITGTEIYNNTMTANTGNDDCGIYLFEYGNSTKIYKNIINSGYYSICVDNDHDNVYISNNVLNGATYRGIYTKAASSNIDIYFNTIYTPGNYGIYLDDEDLGYDVRNNIIYMTSSSVSAYGIYILGGGSGTVINYNDVYIPNGAKYGSAPYAKGIYATLADWKAATPYDDNSISADPLFITTGSDFHLDESPLSPCMGAGADLSGSGYTDDIEDVARPASPAIGAYEGDGGLPVELLSFTATCKNDINYIRWTTASEINNDYFTIEKCNGRVVANDPTNNWEIITIVNGAGNSYTIQHYEYVDDKSKISDQKSQIYYYRLKQTDFDGKYSYSDIVSVDCGKDEKEAFEIISILNNNGEGKITVFFNAPGEEKINLYIYDVFGRQLHSGYCFATEGMNFFNADLGSHSPGVYLLILQNSNEYFTEKIMVK
ncbi:MAG: right-handed parallel beta-helix repeat-containing protein [Bacteroidetes bacterium]|nr:right-handed parallel beta-helix repeat-containing protein [Bacteroidota bacterium]